MRKRHTFCPSEILICVDTCHFGIFYGCRPKFDRQSMMTLCPVFAGWCGIMAGGTSGLDKL